MNQNILNLLEQATEEIENCYGRETRLSNEIRNFINNNKMVCCDNCGIVFEAFNDEGTILESKRCINCGASKNCLHELERK